MRFLRFTGAAVVALAVLPFLSAPASAEPVGYTGIVSDESGAPVPDACLTLYTSETQTAGQFCSDADGRYLITGVPTGTSYKIRVTAAGYRTEWWWRAPNYLNAESVGIPANSLIEENVTVGRGAGTLSGRIIDQQGAGADAEVAVHGVDSYYEAKAYTWDLGDGRYQLDNLPPGRYRISIYDNARGTQWVPGKDTQDEATIYTVTDGGSLVVDEQWLPLGSVEVRVTDDNGKPVPRPCVYLNTAQDVQGCGADGLVRVDNVPPGYWEYSVSGGASYFSADNLHVEVARGQIAKLTQQLVVAAAVTTRVVDSATGQPVDGICVHLVVPAAHGQSAHMSQTCSDTDGRLELGPYDSTFSFQLYAWQSRSPYTTPPVLYGDQWVTANGGSGDQRQALTVTALARQTVAIPEIRMDRPGTISGVIRDQAGAPVPGICTYPYAFNSGQGAIFGKNCSGADGRYTITDLGPYRWPVEFTPYSNSGFGWQWSGDVADRFSASYTQVTVGGTATVNARLVKGGKVAGTITRDGAPEPYTYVYTYNTTTGDMATGSYGLTGRDGTFTVDSLRSQQLLVEYFSAEKRCYYGQSRWPQVPTLRTVGVTAGATTTVAMDMTKTCAAPPRSTAPVRPAATR